MKLKNYIVLFFLLLSLAAFSQDQKLKLSVSNANVKEIFKEIKAQSGLTFIYNEQDVARIKPVTLKADAITVKDVMERCLKDSGLTWVIDDGVIIIKQQEAEKKNENQEPVSQELTVHGVITDEDGGPVPGVNIVYVFNKMMYAGTTSDVDGNYSILLRKPGGTLNFSSIGFESQSIPVKDKEEINVQLKTTVTEISDVVVTGYFEKRKDSYTGSARSFSGEDLRSISTNNVLSTLAVIDPGFKMVDNINAGSDPNHIPEFIIQGQSSLESEYGNTPNMPTFILDGFQVSAQQVFDLDPNRVKSMTILKDAAATAIYGSRAANGVVVVETIEPVPGKLKFNYTGSADFSVADLSYYNLLNASEKLEYEVLAGLYSSSNIFYQDDYLDQYNERKKLVAQGYNTDWIAIPLHDVGVSQKHSVYIEGGDQTFRYGVNFNYNGVDGVMKGSSNDKLGTSIKLQYRLKNLNIMNQVSYNQVVQKNSPYGEFSQYTNLNPYYYPYNENGSYKKVLIDFESPQIADVYNPLYNTTLSLKDESHYNNFTDNFSLDWKITNGIRFKTNVSYNINKGQTDDFKPADHTDFVNSSLKGSYIKGVTETSSFDGNAVLSLFKTIKKNSLNVVMISNLTQTVSDDFKVEVYNFPNENLDHISSGIEYKEGAKPSGSNDISRLVGFVTNINYAYDNRYLLDLSVRTDGSSIYGADRRWGTFGSLGAGWNIHYEGFMEGVTAVDELKLRASTGVTGSNNFSPYQAMMMYSYNHPSINNITYDGRLGTLLMAYGNTNLQWQTTKKNNVGLDFSLFDKRFTGIVNLYKNVSSGVLIDVLLAPSTGFYSFKDNLGKVENKGFEITLRDVVLKKQNLQWDLFLAITQNRNKLLELNDALIAFNDLQDATTTEDENTKPVVRYNVGQPISTIWANESLGIDPNTGQEVFLDMNGEKTNTWSTANYKPMGKGDPDFYGNFGTSLQYKSWRLESYFLYSYGGDIYNNTLVDKVENVDPRNNVDKRVLYDRWKNPGDIAAFKGISNKSKTMPTSRFIERENYISLKSLNLSYYVPNEKLKNYGIERCKLSFIGNDIFRWSTVKTERGIAYPFARDYSLSVQLTF